MNNLLSGGCSVVKGWNTVILLLTKLLSRHKVWKSFLKTFSVRVSDKTALALVNIVFRLEEKLDGDRNLEKPLMNIVVSFYNWTFSKLQLLTELRLIHWKKLFLIVNLASIHAQKSLISRSCISFQIINQGPNKVYFTTIRNPKNLYKVTSEIPAKPALLELSINTPIIWFAINEKGIEMPKWCIIASFM